MAEVPPWDDPTSDPYVALSNVLIYQRGIQDRAEREYDQGVWERQMAELGVRETMDLGPNPESVLAATARQHLRIEDIVARWLPAYLGAIDLPRVTPGRLRELIAVGLDYVGLEHAERVHVGDGGAPMDVKVGNIGIVIRLAGMTVNVEADLARYALNGGTRHLVLVTRRAKHRKLAGREFPAPHGTVKVELARMPW